MSAQPEQEIDKESKKKALVNLITEISNGNELALERLYEETVDHIFGIASRILGPGPDAEEVSEDTYLYVWHNAKRFDAELGHPLAWLITLVRSRAIDRYRHQSKHTKVRDALAQEATNITVHEEPLALLYSTKLHTCIEALPQVQRQILTLAYFRGMSHAEIAQDLSMSLGTVKTHIRRTLIALRDEVEA
ncbi:MAG: sigma-70 family RNA polymerase sigma factor [Pseudomonadota bacterium]